MKYMLENDFEEQEPHKLFLIFVKPIFLGDEFNHYKLYFSKNPDEAIGENWEKICSSDVGNPEIEFIDKICTFKSFDKALLTLFENDYYTYIHGIYKVIPLIYEDVEKIIRDTPDNLPDEIFKLSYAEEYSTVQDKMMKHSFYISERKAHSSL